MSDRRAFQWKDRARGILLNHGLVTARSCNECTARGRKRCSDYLCGPTKEPDLVCVFQAARGAITHNYHTQYTPRHPHSPAQVDLCMWALWHTQTDVSPCRFSNTGLNGYSWNNDVHDGATSWQRIIYRRGKVEPSGGSFLQNVACGQNLCGCHLLN